MHAFSVANPFNDFNVRYQGAKVWNAISDNVNLLSLKQFKNKFKSSIIASY